MSKRAVIYVRTSSEQQGEKNSPAEQESDCRQFAEREGLIVVNVYRDIERYRSRNKWVEPSGTRYDRPGLLAMLRDAGDDQFDVILAWREDRLYRGMRAMLLVLETIQQHGLSIMLANETFDPATAPLKAWLAQMELENIKERMTMGVKARLKAGKANSGQDRYGYRRNGEVIEVVPEEARWVRQIFAWFIEGLNKKQIRKRLIAANAPQKEATRERKVIWSHQSIEGILMGAEAYATGIKVQRREGDAFEIPVEPLIDMETYEKFLQVRRKPVKHSVPGLKKYYLAPGLLHCACGQRWQQRGATSHYRHPKGKWVKRKTIKGVYFCPAQYEEQISPDCPRKIDRLEADLGIWRQVSHVINDPELLLSQAQNMVEELRSNALHSVEGLDRIEKELENATYNRQWVITQARKGSITEDEMQHQLNELSLLEVQLKGELASFREIIDVHLLENWEATVKEYLTDLQEGIRALGVDPGEAEWMETFDLRQRIVQMLVEKIIVGRDGNLTVVIHLDLLGLLHDKSNSGNGGGDGAGRWPHARPMPKQNSRSRAKQLKSGCGHIRFAAF